MGDTANPHPQAFPKGSPPSRTSGPTGQLSQCSRPASPVQLLEGQRRGRWGRPGRPSARCPLSAACSPVRPGRLGGASRRLPPPILVLIGCQAEISEKRTRPARVKLPPKPGAERGISLGREEAGEAAFESHPSPPARPLPAQWAARSYLTFFPGPESDTPSTGPGGHLPVPRAGLGPPGMPMVRPLLACLLCACDAILCEGFEAQLHPTQLLESLVDPPGWARPRTLGTVQSNGCPKCPSAVEGALWALARTSPGN